MLSLLLLGCLIISEREQVRAEEMLPGPAY